MQSKKDNTQLFNHTIFGSINREPLHARLNISYGGMSGYTNDMIKAGWIFEVVAKKYSANKYLYGHFTETNLIIKVKLPIDFFNVQVDGEIYLDAIFICHNKNTRFKLLQRNGGRIEDGTDRIVNYDKNETIMELFAKISLLQTKNKAKRKRKIITLDKVLTFIRKTA